ncbi:ABCC11 [Bugula neritina]|uniref:ABCC11 n=1 Tax=Bugula neritina TaxID=10212 RepID=A0A7J7JQC5_BUGNE|nr:ABCC11 [Bugula neritina]
MSRYTEDYEPDREDKSYQGWKHLIPFRSDSRNPKTLPLITAGPLSYATGVWLNKLIFQSNKNELTQDDLYDTPWRDSASCNMNMFERIWDEEVSRYGKEKSSVVRAVYKLIRPRFFVAAFLTILLSLYAVVGPLINLCALDGQRLYLAILYGIFGLGCVGAVFGGLYSVYLLGPWGSSGFVFFLAFLPLPEILIAESTTFEVLPIRDADNLIEIRNGYFGWSSEVKSDFDGELLTSKTKKRKKRNYPDYKKSPEEESQLLANDNVDLPDEHTIVTLHNISLSVKEGALLGICGAVGSGKTSIIQTILRMVRSCNS